MQRAPVPAVLSDIDLHPRDVSAALAGLLEVSARMRRRRDFRAVFPDVYAIITRNVRDEIIGETGFFEAPEFISRLAGRFSERYFETLVWSLQPDTQDCTAWGLAYDYGERRATIPFQDAVLGISAHINFDLAQGLYLTIREFGSERDAVKLARYKHDHDAVNLLLAKSLPETFELLRDRYACRASRVMWNHFRWPVRPLTLRTLGVWRSTVWDDVIRLLEAKGEAGRAPILVEMEERSARVGRFLTAGSAAMLRGRSLSSWLWQLAPGRGFDALLSLRHYGS